MGEARYVLWLNRLVGEDLRLYRGLVKRLGNEKAVFDAAAARKNLGLEDDTHSARFFDAAKEAKIDQYIAWLKRHEIAAVAYLEEGYPPLLKEIYDPPPILFVRGRLPEPEKLTIAMVGARANTRYGAQVAKEFAFELAAQGCCVVSGMAYGIDACAARAALLAEANTCPTVAVLGCGADVVYPEQNRELYEQITQRGAVVSEYAPGSPPFPYHFPRRNRIIAGLCRGVVVVEAGERSGASITVNHALDQGRDVFAVPGRITDAKSRGANRFIRDSLAKPVLEVGDILEEYGLQAGQRVTSAPLELGTLSPLERRVVELLADEAIQADELCQILGVGTKELNSALTSLEFSGIMKQLPGRVYSL